MVRIGVRLPIFDTFETKNKLTGEANRQRLIITILARSNNPIEKTRTGISQLIAKEHKIAWKNIYSGIFRDMDEILVPMGIVEEDGRLPLKRGPKALQEKGIPYYHLTKKGILVALSISGTGDQERLLGKFFAESEPGEREFEKTISTLQRTSPNFTRSIFEKYVRAFCKGKFKDLLPFDPAKLKEIHDESLVIQKEILEAFMTLSKQEREEAIKFLDRITTDDSPVDYKSQS